MSKHQPYVYKSVAPTPGPAVPKEAQWVGTTRPDCLHVGWSTEEGLDLMAACALHAGHDVWIVVTPRPLYSDEVADLYVLEEALPEGDPDWSLEGYMEQE